MADEAVAFDEEDEDMGSFRMFLADSTFQDFQLILFSIFPKILLIKIFLLPHVAFLMREAN